MMRHAALVFVLLLAGCGAERIDDAYRSDSEGRDAYVRSLVDAGLARVDLVEAWTRAAEQQAAGARELPPVELPVDRLVDFEAAGPTATAVPFVAAGRVEVLVERPGDVAEVDPGQVFLDLYRIHEDGPVLRGSSRSAVLRFTADPAARYLLLMQPAILESGRFRLRILGAGEVEGR